MIKLALPGTELCAALIAFEFDDSGAGLLSLLASFEALSSSVEERSILLSCVAVGCWIWIYSMEECVMAPSVFFASESVTTTR